MKVIKDLSNSTRVRHFNVVFYGTNDELLKIIHTYRTRIQRYAFLEHLYDTWTDDVLDVNGEIKYHKGDIKKRHIHLVVSFYNACTLRACFKLFTTDLDKPRVESVGDMQTVYEYLWHKNDPDKYQYNKSDITSDDLTYYEKLCINGEPREVDNKAEQIILDLLANVPTRVMVMRYGRDFIIHMNQYRDCADKIRSEDFYEKERKRSAEAYERAKLEELSKPEQIELPF